MIWVIKLNEIGRIKPYVLCELNSGNTNYFSLEVTCVVGLNLYLNYHSIKTSEYCKEYFIFVWVEYRERVLLL